MGFIDKFKEFDKIMSEPCFYLHIDTDGDKKNIQLETIQTSRTSELEQENRELKRLLSQKKVNSIDTDFKMLE